MGRSSQLCARSKRCSACTLFTVEQLLITYCFSRMVESNNWSEYPQRCRISVVMLPHCETGENKTILLQMPLGHHLLLCLTRKLGHVPTGFRRISQCYGERKPMLWDDRTAMTREFLLVAPCRSAAYNLHRLNADNAFSLEGFSYFLPFNDTAAATTLCSPKNNFVRTLAWNCSIIDTHGVGSTSSVPSLDLECEPWW